MPNLFNDIVHPVYQSTYAGLPINELEKTATILDQYYWKNRQDMDEVAKTMSRVDVDPQNKKYVDNVVTDVNNIFKKYVDNGDYENASVGVMDASKRIQTDVSLRKSIEHKQIRDKTKAQIDTMYHDGKLSAEQHTDRIQRFNSYQGLEVDEQTGLIKDYSFDFGPEYINFDKYADNIKEKFEFDTTTTGTETRNIPKTVVDMNGNVVPNTFGLADKETYTENKYTKAEDYRAYFDKHLRDDSTAIEYIKDELRIRNGGVPPTEEQVKAAITDKVNQAVSKYRNIDRKTISKEVDEISRYNAQWGLRDKKEQEMMSPKYQTKALAVNTNLGIKQQEIDLVFGLLDSGENTIPNNNPFVTGKFGSNANNPFITGKLQDGENNPFITGKLEKGNNPFISAEWNTTYGKYAREQAFGKIAPLLNRFLENESPGLRTYINKFGINGIGILDNELYAPLKEKLYSQLTEANTRLAEMKKSQHYSALFETSDISKNGGLDEKMYPPQYNAKVLNEYYFGQQQGFLNSEIYDPEKGRVLTLDEKETLWKNNNIASNTSGSKTNIAIQGISDYTTIIPQLIKNDIVDQEEANKLADKFYTNYQITAGGKEYYMSGMDGYNTHTSSRGEVIAYGTEEAKLYGKLADKVRWIAGTEEIIKLPYDPADPSKVETLGLKYFPDYKGNGPSYVLKNFRTNQERVAKSVDALFKQR